MSMRPVRPVPPIAPYQGGKRNLAGALVEAIDSIDHDCYAEPFVGMGGVFLRGARAPASTPIRSISARRSICESPPWLAALSAPPKTANGIRSRLRRTP